MSVQRKLKTGAWEVLRAAVVVKEFFNYCCYSEKSDFWFSPLPEEVTWNANGKINDKKKKRERGKSSASNCTKRNVKGNFYGLHVEAICWPTTAAGWLYAAWRSCHICLVSEAGQPAAWRSSHGDTDHHRQTETVLFPLIQSCFHPGSRSQISPET